MNDRSIVERASAAGWRLPFARLVTSRRPVVLLYHETPRSSLDGHIDSVAFERHIRFLREHFDFVRPDELPQQRRPGDRPRVLITFDDGFRSNAEHAVPILRRYGVPAIFFVSHRHATPGRFLWFAYLRGLRHRFSANGFTYRGEFMDMRREKRSATMDRLEEHLLSLRPHPTAMYEEIEHELPPLSDFMSPAQILDSCAGMSEEQIAELSSDSLFSIGAHTTDHPYLTRCDGDEAYRQVAENKAWIENACSKACTSFAYPLGDYHDRVLSQIREIGFDTAYAVMPRMVGDPVMEVPRMGVYSHSRDVLGLKVVWGNAMRSKGLAVG